MEESEWIDKLRNGDRAAFGELVATYGPRVINTCFRFLLNKEDAEDTAQEVFVEVFRSIKHFEGQAKLSTWIYRIAISRSLDEIKKRNRQKRFSSIAKMLSWDRLADWLGGGMAADKLLLEDELLRELHQALGALPDNQRVAFTLSKIEGYSNGEIAELMDTTIEAVESLVYRAKKKVSAELKIILQKK
jgi:RNA polymerase sigma-70 factor (ECF subfamily)